MNLCYRSYMQKYNTKSKPGLIRRSRQLESWDECGQSHLPAYSFRCPSVRADFCLTSLFSASWMCRCCGWEICSDCFTLRFDSDDVYQVPCLDLPGVHTLSYTVNSIDVRQDLIIFIKRKTLFLYLDSTLARCSRRSTF